MLQRFKKRKLTYSGHAREQMERRGITEDDVEEALESADTSYPGADKKRENLVKVGTCSNGRRLNVIVKKRKQHIVVTTYWG